jgi:hypothetical protein
VTVVPVPATKLKQELRPESHSSGYLSPLPQTPRGLERFHFAGNHGSSLSFSPKELGEYSGRWNKQGKIKLGI